MRLADSRHAHGPGRSIPRTARRGRHVGCDKPPVASNHGLERHNRPAPRTRMDIAADMTDSPPAFETLLERHRGIV
ncbi:MAG: hypothetical protein KA124_14920, partial [Luteimonas sp.]|nr:hypothetical protein [Luteimonas sp.]